jgi:FAD/FMN-containing dehydrogenase
MRADGSIVTCSRKENAELFSLALGGYGLFGVILDVDLHVVPNEQYRLQQFIVPSAEALKTFDQALDQGDEVAMAYARLDVSAEQFLQQAIINVLYRDASTGALPPLEDAGMRELRRALFRGSIGSDYGKRLRWKAETELQPRLQHARFSRNQLLNESVETFRNQSAESTDILHEYFVTRGGIAHFLRAVQTLVPRHGADLLNVTVRYVDTDDVTVLRYATEPMLSLVMLFNQPTTAAGDSRMEALTRDLIDAALDAGGRYYLPYRLHATREQFARAYPQGADFFDAKRRYDPDELFQNEFYLKYGQRR